MTFAGLSRVTYVGEPLDLGHGIVLRSTYTHLFAANMMAFARAPEGKPHPPPWRATQGGFGYDVEVELVVPEPGRQAPMLLRDTMGLFTCRYSLCMLLYYMEWVHIGRQTGKKLPLRVNDVVDMQLTATGTFFNGVLSADENLQMVSNTARGVLRSFGAYVGEDWRVPQPTPESDGGIGDASPADPG